MPDRPVGFRPTKWAAIRVAVRCCAGAGPARRCGPYTPVAIWLLACLLLSGCRSSDWVRVRQKPSTPLAAELSLFSWRGPQPTDRTRQLMRRYDLTKTYRKSPKKALDKLIQLADRSDNADHAFAVAELAFIAGERAHRLDRLSEALDLYGISVAHAHAYLLSGRYGARRNPFDPRFRLASDIYNGALESSMRIVQQRGQLKPGGTHLIVTDSQQYEVTVACRGSWDASEIGDLKFVSDYRVIGLKNHYRTYGLGVPMIGVYNPHSGRDPAEKLYAPGMSFPITAFLRVLPGSFQNLQTHTGRHFCVLELHDPMVTDALLIEEQLVPLETDLSTPLAYSLNDPAFRNANLPTLNLLNPAKRRKVQGLYLLERYDPRKIPVLMVHGLWSNLVTWMEMFNDLRGMPEIRDNYQFWFYLYPTGQPLWLTADDLRNDLADAREAIDPTHSVPRLNQMVVVAHSMGGLIARMQTLQPPHPQWRMVLQRNHDRLNKQEKESLRKALRLEPNPDIRRVITIATPHHGSHLSNRATQWLGRQLIRLPEPIERATLRIVRGPNDMLTLPAGQTSIEGLSPESPLLQLINQAKPAAWVHFHNIIGRIDDGHRLIRKVSGDSDGVVTVESARLEYAESELIVPADHMHVHRHPRTILEVQRILLEHLEAVKRSTIERLPPPEQGESAVSTDSTPRTSADRLARPSDQQRALESPVAARR